MVDSAAAQTDRTSTADTSALLVSIEARLIGWALREVARRDPDWVRTFVDTHQLSPLSRREALKHLGESEHKGEH